jgi:hypothetical protein
MGKVSFNKKIKKIDPYIFIFIFILFLGSMWSVVIGSKWHANPGNPVLGFE